MVDALGVDTVVMRLMENVDVASLPDGDRTRLAHDVRAQRPIPALTAGERAELIRFARETDERIKRFAVTLAGLRTRHHSGITMETAHGEVSTFLRAEFYLRDPDMRRWKAEELIRGATSAGLLMHSREMQEAGFDVADYLANPSFDYGPLVHLAGPLVVDWLNRRGLDDTGWGHWNEGGGRQEIVGLWMAHGEPGCDEECPPDDGHHQGWEANSVVGSFAAKAVVQPCWHSPHKGSDLEHKTLGAGYSAQRLKRVFQIDVETCRACGGAIKIIA